MSKMRTDLAERGYLIPDAYLTTNYTAEDIQDSTYLESTESDHVLLLLKDNRLAVVYSIDLE